MCNVVVQYMCESTAPGLRDGTPESPTDSATDTITEATNDNPRYGSHEPMSYYKKCKTRRRNAGLYIADQRQQTWGRLMENSPAVETRQNPNGDRHGWECPEERDYYVSFQICFSYSHVSIIAILASNSLERYCNLYSQYHQMSMVYG